MPNARKTKERLEIERFLQLLEVRIHALAHTAETASTGVAERRPHVRFSDYVQARDLSSECWAFSIVIERRIELYHGPDATMLRAKFDQLTIAIWSTLLTTSLRFLDALSQERNLPLGSREIFVREIKTLYDAHRLLSDPRYDTLIDDTMRTKQRQAERILNEIIERAPALLDFGA